MTSKVLINAANLHSGGGVQVAVSFIYELLAKKESLKGLEFWVSREVASNLESLGIDLDSIDEIKTYNVFGLGALVSKLNFEISRFDLVFTIFGPNYFFNKKYIDLVGFAQAWILDNSAYHLLDPFNRMKARLKFLFQKYFFKTADAFVVELDHVRNSLFKDLIAGPGSVYVAHNCISSIYLQPETWKPLPVSIEGSLLKIGFLGRDYIHKNTDILPLVKDILEVKHGVKVDFYVTFNDVEWAGKSEKFRSNIKNIGSLAVTQCPSFYQDLDAVIFPSLLECFSATPLEALAMSKPLFASDRGFVRDVCADFALYFDPLDPENVADVIAENLYGIHSNGGERLVAAREHALNFSSAKDRADRYLEVIRVELAKCRACS